MAGRKTDMRKLHRSDLIDIIYELQRQVNTLEEQNAQLTEELQDRVIRMENAGSIAEAALALNHVFEAAQKAADQYLFSIRSAGMRTEEQPQKEAEDE